MAPNTWWKHSVLKLAMIFCLVLMVLMAFSHFKLLTFVNIIKFPLTFFILEHILGEKVIKIFALTIFSN